MEVDASLFLKTVRVTSNDPIFEVTFFLSVLVGKNTNKIKVFLRYKNINVC